jgi:hypothetical protein
MFSFFRKGTLARTSLCGRGGFTNSGNNYSEAPYVSQRTHITLIATTWCRCFQDWTRCFQNSTTPESRLFTFFMCIITFPIISSIFYPSLQMFSRLNNNTWIYNICTFLCTRGCLVLTQVQVPRPDSSPGRRFWAPGGRMDLLGRAPLITNFHFQAYTDIPLEVREQIDSTHLMIHD